MVVACPHCQAWLDLPEHAAGSQVRCSICREEFRADQNAHNGSAQAGSPKSASATPKSRGGEGRPCTKTQRLGHEDDSDAVGGDNNDERQESRLSRPGSKELIENAKIVARPAGYAMLAAFIITTLNFVGNMVLTVLSELDDPAQAEMLPLFFCGVVCSWITLGGPILACIGTGATSLFRLGSRFAIIAAIIMNITALLLLGGAVVLCLILLPAVDFVVGTGLAANTVSSLVNATAGAMAVRVLASQEVADAYAARAEEQRQRRGPY